MIEFNDRPGKQQRHKIRVKEVAAVAGRAHCSMQTDPYEDDLDVWPTREIQTQTTASRPQTPDYQPKKYGHEMETQVFDGDFFDWDTDEQVENLVADLVDRTIDEAITELAREAELARLYRQRRVFEIKREAEIAEIARLADIERQKELEMHRQLVMDIIKRDLMPQVFQVLSRTGKLVDDVIVDPRVQREREAMQIARQLMDDMIQASVL